jgi:hypothetical protein
MKRTRYEYLYELVDLLQPKSIIEIGVAKGKTAKNMLSRSGKDTRYTGYDVFDFSDKEFHRMVGNGKEVWSLHEIRRRLSDYGDKVQLIKGMTQDTLWKTPKSAELVFIDGDHRVESIRGDHKAVAGSKVIVFDDYYLDDHGLFDMKNYGCHSIVNQLENISITPPCEKLPHVRLAIWCEDNDTHKRIQEILV